MTAIRRLDANAKHLILVNSPALSDEQVMSVGKFVGNCIIVPVQMQYLPEGNRLDDAIQFYELA